MIIFHDDVIKWKHFPRYWSFVRGMVRVIGPLWPMNSPPQRPVRRSFDIHPPPPPPPHPHHHHPRYEKGYHGSSYYIPKSFISHKMNTWSCTFWQLAIVFVTKNSPKAFPGRVGSHFHVKFGSKRVLSGENNVLVLVADLGKATISMQMANKLPPAISIMEKVICKTFSQTTLQ